MNLTGNTIFITGGTSGIGRGLAEALHRHGNQVIISGRRRGHLEEVLAENRGMMAIELDVQDPDSIAYAAERVIANFPALNVLINNAGIMKLDNIAGELDETVLQTTIKTNLFGPMRMTSALVEHLKQQKDAAVINVTSGLAFVPLSMTAIYCATKAAIHSYTLSLRYKLKDTSVRVLELAPPYVQTDLLGGAEDPRAMPLPEFIDETVKVLGSDADEILVERVMMLREGAGRHDYEATRRLNEMMSGGH